MTKVNPKVKPTPRAVEVAAEIQRAGGTLTAAEWEFTRLYETHGTAWDRAGALALADKDGAIVGSDEKGWKVYRRRKGEPLDDIDSMDRQRLEAWARTLERLDVHRERLEAALPECPDHGRGCTPFLVAWIAKAIAAGISLDPDEIPQPTDEQHAQVVEAFAKLSR